MIFYGKKDEKNAFSTFSVQNPGESIFFSFFTAGFLITSLPGLHKPTGIGCECETFRLPFAFCFEINVEH